MLTLWTDPVLTDGLTTIETYHIQELRDAVNATEGSITSLQALVGEGALIPIGPAPPANPANYALWIDTSDIS